MNEGNIDVTIHENGNLRITADLDARVWLTEEKEKARYNDHMILWDAMEKYWCHGSFYPFDAGSGNPFIGLTEAPCIAEEMESDDTGKNTLVGLCWAYLDYQTKSFIDELRHKGSVTFILV